MTIDVILLLFVVVVVAGFAYDGLNRRAKMRGDGGLLDGIELGSSDSGQKASASSPRTKPFVAEPFGTQPVMPGTVPSLANGNGHHGNGYNGNGSNGNGNGHKSNGNGYDSNGHAKFTAVRQTIGRQLQALGGRLSPAEFILLAAMVALVAFLVSSWLFPRSIFVAAIVALLAVYLLLSVVSDLADWRVRRFEADLADAIDLMVASLQGGENPTQAIASAADGSTGAVRAELARVVDRLGMGVPIDRTLERMLHIYDCEGVRLFAHTLIAKWQTGGDLAPVLRSIAHLLREQLKLRLHLGSQLAGARLASFAVALLPYLVIPAFLFSRPQWIDSYSVHPLGPPLIIAGVLFQLLGLLWIRRLLRLEL